MADAMEVDPVLALLLPPPTTVTSWQEALELCLCGWTWFLFSVVAVVVVVVEGVREAWLRPLTVVGGGEMPLGRVAEELRREWDSSLMSIRGFMSEEAS